MSLLTDDSTLVLIQHKMVLRANPWLICKRPFWRRVGMGDAFWPTLRSIHTVFICHSYLLCRMQQNEMTAKHSKCTLWSDAEVLREWPCCHGSLYISPFEEFLFNSILFMFMVFFCFILTFSDNTKFKSQEMHLLRMQTEHALVICSVKGKKEAIFLFHRVAALL